jgi:hypothetical protein
MLTIVDSSQIPDRRSSPYQGIQSLPIDGLSPGQAIRIPFEMFPGDNRSLARVYGAIRSRVCRARKSTGLSLRVFKTADAFYVTRTA